MGYVAVRGGGAAIEESLRLLEYDRVSASAPLDVDQIAGTFPELIDQVMGEASLYAPRLAALALKQARGLPDEAVFLLRAFRSTLERPYVSRPVDTGAMWADRRISAAFKDVPGGQVLGATRDYSHRLLAFDLECEDQRALDEKREALAAHFDEVARDQAPDRAPDAAMTLPRVLDYLREQGLVRSRDAAEEDGDPVDATMAPLTFPAPRSVRLQTLARGMTQAVEALGYAAIRGFGPAHPTVGELRHGLVPIAVDAAPAAADGAGKDDAYYVGSLPITEVESVFTDDGASGGELSLAIGYGCVMGGAETKAIAMSVLDRCLDAPEVRYPTEDEEFVLYHVDGVEASGFISHLKLPHYVTFQSKLSSVRSTRDGGEAELAAESKEETHAAQL
ncbi:carbon-phosphorus lyase complex subunit PhnI [Adlercreutzia equolifaciens]|uniref:Carbon-phosphorus lyase n=1 Tax=Adlercreutzia equolifaciens subsp. celatus DSM 18785 TaxID=1121021 RepID=A0A3N0AUV8_9ACTN|nr:carbon-phosphorus lyase complex subunit PhnI [Adlercreutzia equolifaciens]MCP2077633.1 alpha-D-ribose 1-methylphosphonate 5-triphosphate synthase subunit PhnI [Adlercreutzia equolifaciens subsp. celatus DSM 18785]RFT80942.1 carbon-phosphorus lyase [Adlercreutzia equolifaciens]RFT94182.1 carbon-phosphorus lyase [Adlercreutzia equolifaciens subsp. celatus]RNL38329.1 carbon-phosphorus lyase [Adlercreutzia equolifaciens subsp. celatus DSM 18785]BAN77643.1 phosphonate metabolism protein PhnI [Ad